MSEIGISLEVEGIEPTPTQQTVLDLYQGNAETFLRKDSDYGSSYIESAVRDCYLRHGEVTDDLLFEQVIEGLNTRMLDKQSRFYNLMFDAEEAHVGGEALDDTLMDWANYGVMTAAQVRQRRQRDSYVAQYDEEIERVRRQLE